MTRYFLTKDGGAEREVSKAEYVAAERAAQFHNTLGQPDEPATFSFGSSTTGVSGRTDEGIITPEQVRAWLDERNRKIIEGNSP